AGGVIDRERVDAARLPVDCHGALDGVQVAADGDRVVAVAGVERHRGGGQGALHGERVVEGPGLDQHAFGGGVTDAGAAGGGHAGGGDGERPAGAAEGVVDGERVPAVLAVEYQGTLEPVHAAGDAAHGQRVVAETGVHRHDAARGGAPHGDGVV